MDRATTPVILGPQELAEREAFEEWALRDGWCGSDLEMALPGEYRNEFVEAHWRCWRACWPMARAAIYSAEQTKIEAPLKAEITRLRTALVWLACFCGE